MSNTRPAARSRAAVVRRRFVGRVRAHPVTIPLCYIAGGLVAGGVMLAVDAAVGESAVPQWLRVGPQVARSSLVGLLTSFLFVISVVFWVRIWAVQVTAQPVLPRVMSQFLTDRVQQHAMGLIIGGMAYVLTVVRGIPEDTGSGTVPHLAVTVAFVDALVVAVVIVLVIHNAARASQVGRLVRQITDESVAFIRSTHPPIGEGVDGAGSYDIPSPPPGPGRVVAATDSGWVLGIDEDLVLTAVPPGAVVELGLRVGSFAFEGQTLARVWGTDDELDEATVQAAFVFGDAPSPRHNLSYGINELVDIASRSISTDTSDSTTVREAVLQLGVVMRELLLHDLPPVHRRDDEGRQLLRPVELGFDDYCEAAFGRVRTAGAGSHELLTILLTIIETISRQLADAQLWDRQALLREQAELAMEEGRRRLSLTRSVERVAARARAAGVETDDDR